MKYDLIIFDLDGTILDTLQDIADACNHALAGHSFPPRTLEEVRTFIGSGVSNLIRKAIPEGSGDDIHARVLADFKAQYFSNLNIRTAPYPGIPDLLKKLRSAGVHVAVNSNKIDPATRSLCEAHFPDTVEYALGERAEINRKPAPDGALHIMRKFNASPERTLYIGDSNTDLQTAENAGLDCAWVSWGFRHANELEGLTVPHAFDTVDALEAFLFE